MVQSLVFKFTELQEAGAGVRDIDRNGEDFHSIKVNKDLTDYIYILYIHCPLLKGKIAKILIYHKAWVKGGINYDYLGQLWVPSYY